MQAVRFPSNNNKHPQGQYLVELLIAIGVFVIVAGAITSIMIDALALYKTNAQRLQANWYLSEGIEAVKSIQKQHWADLAIGTFGIAASSNHWVLQATPDTQGNLERRVIIEWAMRDTAGDIQATGEADAWAKKIRIAIINQQTTNTIAEQTLYLTFAEGSEWLETTQTDFNDGTFTNTVVTASGDGGITLAQGTGSQFGFPMLINNFSSVASLANNNHRIAMRFTPTITSPLDRIHVFLSSQGGPTATYRIGIQADVGGFPSGTYLTSGTFTPTTTGWHMALMGTTITLTPGTPMYVVIQHASGSGNITLRTSQPVQTINPRTGESDPAFQTIRSTNGGSSWTNLNTQPIFVAVSTTQEVDGNAFTASATSPVWGTLGAAERFKTSSALTVTGFRFAISRNNTPAGNLICTLTDITASQVLYQNTCATPAQVATSINWVSHTLTSTIILPSNHEFRLAFTSPSSTQSSRRYNIPNYTATSSSPYVDVTFQGVDAFAESAVGTTWTPAAGADRPFGLVLASGYSLSGTYISSPYDTGSNQTRFASLLMHGSIPGTSTMTAQIRTADTIPGLASAVFVGPDGTPATSYSTLASVMTHAGASGTQFVQYKITMTGDGATASTLNDISILYEP